MSKMKLAGITGFVAVATQPNKTPNTRFYIHEAGLDIFGKKDPVCGSKNRILAANKFLVRMLQLPDVELEKYDFVLGTVWADPKEQKRAIDVFGYTGINPWPGDPDVEMFSIRKGSRQPVITCEDSLIMLGKEGEFRRQCVNLKEYGGHPFDIMSTYVSPSS